jgi:hypothetical protein
VIRDENLQQQRSENNESCHEVPIDAGDKLSHFAHGGDIRGNVERVSNQKEQHNRL